MKTARHEDYIIVKKLDIETELKVLGTAVAAGDLSAIASAVAGVLTASKVLVADANALVQGMLYCAERTFTETSGAGTYTATVPIPAGATVVDLVWKNTVVWNNAGTCVAQVGDDDDADGYLAAVDIKTVPGADTVGYGGLSTKMSDTGSGVYKGKGGKYCAAAKTITATVVTSSTGGGNGRSRLLVFFMIQTPVAAIKV